MSLTRDLYIRLLGLVLCVAFTSVWVQVLGLVGEEGLIPVGRMMEAGWEEEGWRAFFDAPSLLWFSPTDMTFQVVCAGGVLCGLLLVTGVLPGPALLGAWFLYLSLYNGCYTFLHYQWDLLLMETCVASLLVAPWSLWLHKARPPERIGVFVIHCLLFKLMFLSGFVKLASGDETWWNLTALQYHYWTQPLPNPLSWFVHYLPRELHSIAHSLMLFIELVVPFFLLLGRQMRAVAFACFLLLLSMLFVTGNYGFFQILTAVLCVLLLDDRQICRFLPSSWRNWLNGGILPSVRWHQWVVGTGALCVVSLSFVWMGWTVARYNQIPIPSAVQTVMRETGRLSAVHTYGLFATMTTERPELVFEGSRDGKTWEPYVFKYKIGPVDRRPPIAGLHMPRLDWQLWFAALAEYRYPGQGCENYPEVSNLKVRLLQGSPAVRGLLEKDPFEDGAPARHIRTELYLYTFADATDADAQVGHWWKRESVAEACGGVLSVP